MWHSIGWCSHNGQTFIVMMQCLLGTNVHSHEEALCTLEMFHSPLLQVSRQLTCMISLSYSLFMNAVSWPSRSKKIPLRHSVFPFSNTSISWSYLNYYICKSLLHYTCSLSSPSLLKKTIKGYKIFFPLLFPGSLLSQAGEWKQHPLHWKLYYITWKRPACLIHSLSICYKKKQISFLVPQIHDFFYFFFIKLKTPLMEKVSTNYGCHLKKLP